MQATWIPWPLRMKLYLPTDLPKKPLASSVLVYHNSTDNSLNQQVNNTNASNNDIPSNVTHNASNPSATRKRSRRKTKPANIQLDHSSVINLSSSSLSTDEIFVLTRGLAINNNNNNNNNNFIYPYT